MLRNGVWNGFDAKKDFITVFSVSPIWLLSSSNEDIFIFLFKNFTLFPDLRVLKPDTCSKRKTIQVKFFETIKKVAQSVLESEQNVVKIGLAVIYLLDMGIIQVASSLILPLEDNSNIYLWVNPIYFQRRTNWILKNSVTLRRLSRMRF